MLSMYQIPTKIVIRSLMIDVVYVPNINKDCGSET